VSRSFSVEDVRTSEQHRPDARSSFSNFYTKLDFSRHYLESVHDGLHVIVKGMTTAIGFVSTSAL
jgi:hypothetical protein